MVDPELLDILVCPETKQPVRHADEALVGRLNAAIERGELRNASGATVEERLDGGLVREDGEVLYPVMDDIPVMLVDEAISLGILDDDVVEGATVDDDDSDDAEPDDAD